jgi:hypothetical protein
MKRPLLNSALVLVIAVLLLGFAPNNGAITTDPEISGILTNIKPNNIFNTAQTLQNFRTRQSCSDVAGPNQGVTAARDYLFAQYSAIPGLQVRLDPFVHGQLPDRADLQRHRLAAWPPS